MSRVKLMKRFSAEPEADTGKNVVDWVSMISDDGIVPGSVGLVLLNLDAVGDDDEIHELSRIAERGVGNNGGVMVCFSTRRSFSETNSAMLRLGIGGGWKIVSEMTWVHTNPPLPFQNAMTYFHNVTHMYVLTQGGEKPKVFNPVSENCKGALDVVDVERSFTGTSLSCVDARVVNATRIMTGVWYGAKEHQVDVSKQIIENHVRSWTDDGMTVLDLTACEGLSVDVCVENNRNIICLCDDEHGIAAIEQRVLSNKEPVDERQLTFNF